MTHHMAHVGYGAVALAIGLESMGVPFPGETTLIAALAFAATGHGLNVGGVVGAAIIGASVGSIIGYWIGRVIGFRLLLRYGSRIGVTERRLKVGVLLFRRYGAGVVFFGRFVAVLRSLAYFLAGVNRMEWGRFMLYNVAGAIAWAGLYGLGAYEFGHHIHHVAKPVAIGIGVFVALLLIAGFLVLRRHESQLADEAERLMPGPLEDYILHHHRPA